MRRKYDIVQSIWIKLIQQMRSLGIGLNTIKSLKENLLEPKIDLSMVDPATLLNLFGELKKNSFISAHINQLFVYLKNLEIKDKSILSGMIIYPENGEKIDSTYNIQGHRVSIKTINLESNPQEINDQMIASLDSFKQSVAQL
jgi:hypothetical protein